jgi:hypothetical protein
MRKIARFVAENHSGVSRYLGGFGKPSASMTGDRYENTTIPHHQYGVEGGRGDAPFALPG